ncbi:hypothetical protein F4780DRAFT_594252 [Xylariomycetidae sp. FL0641]|nr:hypothetical protein F4780DRAFT_594252 [Xylariomycetidae sp. FL0641]
MNPALAIPEILEAILLHLDMTTLLVSAPRVNRMWEALIRNSIPVQQALYFWPIDARRAKSGPDSSLEPGDDKNELYGYKYPSTLNPLLLKWFGDLFFETGGNGEDIGNYSKFGSMPWVLSCNRDRPGTASFVKSRTGQMGWEKLGQAALRASRGVLGCIPIIDTLGVTAAAPEASRDPIEVIFSPASPEEQEELVLATRRFMRKEASWRRMLVSQPPPPFLGYMNVGPIERIFIDRPFYTALIDPPNTHPPGLRMGALYDVVQHHVSTPRTGIRFQVLWTWGTALLTGDIYAAWRKLLERTNAAVAFIDNSHPNYRTPDINPVGEPEHRLRASEHRWDIFDRVFLSEGYEPIDTEPRVG